MSGFDKLTMSGFDKLTMSGFDKLTMSGFDKLTMSGFDKLTMSGCLSARSAPARPEPVEGRAGLLSRACRGTWNIRSRGW
jgi:hypothetical protein